MLLILSGSILEVENTLTIPNNKIFADSGLQPPPILSNLDSKLVDSGLQPPPILKDGGRKA